MYTRWLRRFVFLFVFLILAGAAAARPSSWEWPLSTPEEQGIDSSGLAKMIDVARQMGTNLHSVVIVRNGHLILDASFFPNNSSTPHELASVTKTIVGTLVGIAIDRGDIEGVDQPVLDFFPEVSAPSPEQRAMTIKHLLTMTSGLQCGDYAGWIASPDSVAYIWAQPMSSQPPAPFHYCGQDSHLLSAIVSRATGMPTQEFARAYLFEPLGISEWTWATDPQGIPIGESRLALSPLDVAKIGQLYLQEGQWNGQQIVSANWVEAATRIQVVASQGGTGQDFGYHAWWMRPDKDVYMAIGSGGQFIIVTPSEKLVTVFTAGLDESDGSAPNGLYNSAVLPAVLSDDPLPPNPEGAAALQAQLDAITYPAPGEIPPLPKLAVAISGHLFNLEANAQGWETFTLEFGEGVDTALLYLTGNGEEVLAFIGMDGVYRLNTIPGGTVALRGRWRGEDRLWIDAQVIGAASTYEIRLQFKDQGVSISIVDPVFGVGNESITGTME
ncbi:MAG: serine hydrolase [Anaerolineae bacterium]|nr:serine hydrolase [Anaerolineae bacterium]